MFLFLKICAGPPGCYIAVIELMDSGAPGTINGVPMSPTKKKKNVDHQPPFSPATLFCLFPAGAQLNLHSRLWDGSTFLAGLIFCICRLGSLGGLVSTL